jgi:hypothetical protein
MRFPHLWFTIAVAAASIACSDDAAETTADAGAPANSDASSGGSGSAAGGMSGAGATGGASGTGGAAGAGGFDPALAAQCGIDAGVDQCRLCLAVQCCDATQTCFGDTGCQGAFDTYQACIDIPGQTDPVGCFSTFVRAGQRDGGGETHGPINNCLIMDCQVCGGLGLL